MENKKDPNIINNLKNFNNMGPSPYQNYVNIPPHYFNPYNMYPMNMYQQFQQQNLNSNKLKRKLPSQFDDNEESRKEQPAMKKLKIANPQPQVSDNEGEPFQYDKNVLLLCNTMKLFEPKIQKKSKEEENNLQTSNKKITIKEPVKAATEHFNPPKISNENEDIFIRKLNRFKPRTFSMLEKDRMNAYYDTLNLTGKQKYFVITDFDENKEEKEDLYKNEVERFVDLVAKKYPGDGSAISKGMKNFKGEEIPNIWNEKQKKYNKGKEKKKNMKK